MKNFNIVILFVLLFFAGFQLNLKAQNKDSVVQFSGVVVGEDSLQFMPYTNISVSGSNEGVVSSFSGFFSLVAQKGDTIVFSSLGYKVSKFVIPDTLSSHAYNIIQIMQKDTFLLQETVIYPWADINALEYAILNFYIQDDDYNRALRNLALEEMKERAGKLDMDGLMNYKYQMTTIANKAYWNGQKMPYRFLDPFAWAEFVKAWKEGKFKRKP